MRSRAFPKGSLFRQVAMISPIFALFIFLVSMYIVNNHMSQWITIEIKTEKNVFLDIYYDVGKGFAERYSVSRLVAGNDSFQNVTLSLPPGNLKSLRIDPLIEPGIVYIKTIRLESSFGRNHVWPAEKILKAFRSKHDIGRFEIVNDSLLVESTGNDPSFRIKAPLAFASKMKIMHLFGILMTASIVLLCFIGLFLRNIKRPLRASPFLWLGLIIMAALLIRTYHITYPLNDMHAFRQTQTAGLIRDYYREGINIFYPKMITLGNPGYVVLEFPLYQALAAVLYKILTPDIIWARLLSISFGLMSIVFVYRIATKFLDQKSAVFSAMFFAFTPLNIFYNRVPMPDSLTILLSLVMLDFLIEGINNKKSLYLLFGIVAGCFGLMMKSPYVAPLYLPIAYMVYKQERKLSFFLNWRFLSALMIPLAAMLLWQRHANYVNDTYWSTNNYPFKELYGCVVVKLKPFNTWYFGTNAQRLDINNYLIILERIFREMLSKWGILFLAVGFFAAIKKKMDVFFQIWFFSVICSIVAVFNLNIVHNFYQMPLTPILAIFCGTGLSWAIDSINNKKAAFSVTVVLVCFYILASWTIAVKFFDKAGNWFEIGQSIDRSTEKNAMIATATPVQSVADWDPTFMYFADRHGFAVPQSRLNEEMLRYLRDKGVKYLAIIDYRGGNDFIDSVQASCKSVSNGNEVLIYDISRRERSGPQKSDKDTI